MDSTPLTPKTTGVLVPTTTPYALAVATNLSDESPLRVEVVISTSDVAALESAWTMGGPVRDFDAETLAVGLDRAGVLSLHHHLDVTLARLDMDPLPLGADAAPAATGYRVAVDELHAGNAGAPLREAAPAYTANETAGARLTAAEFWADAEPNRAVPDVQPLSADEVAGHRRDAVDAIVNGRGPRGYHVAVLELVATVEAQARARAEEAAQDHYEGPGRMRLSRSEDTEELVIGTEVDGRVTDVYVPTHEAAQLGGLLLRCVARDLALAGVRRLLRVTEDVDVRLTQRRRAREDAR